MVDIVNVPQYVAPSVRFQNVTIKRQILSAYSLIIILSLPLWWYTTSIQRLSLPVGQVKAVEGAEASPPNESSLDTRAFAQALQVSMDQDRSRYPASWEGIKIYLNDDKQAVPLNDPVTYTIHIHPEQAKLESKPDMWIHGRTLNIIKKSQSDPLDKLVSPVLCELIAPYKRVRSKIQERSTARYSRVFRLAFSLLNEDSSHGSVAVRWDIEQAINRYFYPILTQLRELHNFTIESQIQFHAPLAFDPPSTISASGRTHYILGEDELKIFINSAEWSLSSGVSGEPILHFVLFIPSTAHHPLTLSKTSHPAFIVPQWGGITFLNHLNETKETKAKYLEMSELTKPFAIFQAQLLTLLGVPITPANVSILPLEQSKQLSEWQLDALYRRRTIENMKDSADTLSSIVKLVDQIQNMPVGLDVRGDVENALHAIERVSNNSTDLSRSLHFSAEANELSSRAFFNPGMLALLYFPAEHKYAVYVPLFGPISLPFLLVLLKESKKWFQERRASKLNRYLIEHRHFTGTQAQNYTSAPLLSSYVKSKKVFTFFAFSALLQTLRYPVMSRDVSQLSYSPLRPILYPNNGNGYSNTLISRENDAYYNSDEMNRRRIRHSWDPSVNSGNFAASSGIPPYRDRSAEPTPSTYEYPPARSYSNGGMHSSPERHTYQYPPFHRNTERTGLARYSQESDYDGFRNNSPGSNNSNGLSNYDNQRGWRPSTRQEHMPQVASSSSSYDDSRRRLPNIDYNSPYSERPSSHDNQRDFSVPWKSESSSQTVPSWSSRHHDPSNWHAKSGVAPKISKPRAFLEPSVRPKHEPSYAWKRTVHEDHDRKSSLDGRTSLPPPDRRRISSDNYTSESRRNNNPQAYVPMQSFPDYPNRRFPQIPIPQSQPPPRFEQRERNRDSYRQFDSFRRAPAAYTPGRRPLHRISARISARPRRSPSPSESSSETSRSRSRQSHRRSPSKSRSSDCSTPRHEGGVAPHSLLRTQSNGVKGLSSNNSTMYMPYHKGITSRSEPSGNSRKQDGTWYYKEMDAVHRKTRRSSSASSYRSESSIASSVNSDPEQKLEKDVSGLPVRLDGPKVTSRKSSPIASTTPAKQESFFPHSQTPLSFPSIDDNLELPGMRFNKNGVPKSDASIHIVSKKDETGTNETGILKPKENSLKSPLTLNEADPSKNNNKKIIYEADQEVYREASEFSLASAPRISTPPAHESNDDDRMDISSDDEVKITVPSTSVIVPIIENENTLPVPSQIPTAEIADQDHTIPLPSTEILESSPLTDFAPLCSSPVIIVNKEIEEKGENIATPVVKGSYLPIDTKNDFASALQQFVANKIDSTERPVETRYDCIFEANHALKDAPIVRKQTTDEDLVQEVTNSVPFQLRLENYPNIAEVLIERLKKRSEDFAAKTRRLQLEYKRLHMRWVSNCRKLDQSLASQTIEPPSPTFRASRRSTGFGDIVRSDLEMEQIIASLGNEDMTDPNVLAIRNTAIIPDLITTDPDILDVSYLDDNGLIENPAEFFDVYSTLGRWTEEEKDLFLEKYGAYPKQFDVIATFLPGKTAAQCTLFYYLHKKELIDFRAAIKKYGSKRKRGRKGGKGKGKGNALLADIMKPSRGQGSEEAGHRHMQQFGGMVAINGQQILSRRSLMLKGPQNTENPSSLNNNDFPSIPDPTTNNGNSQPAKFISEEVEDLAIVVDHRRKRSVKPIDLTPEPDIVVAPVEKVKRPPGRPPKKPKEPSKVDETGSSTPAVKVTSYVWTKYEEAQYAKLVKEHGKDFKKIAAGMPAKTELQCRNYFRKHREFERIAKEVEDRLAKSTRS
ncbi:hypothetical protein Clacol_009251 [Clathrus columnatus]|uniref:SANT domain-containing protein n=1 Tax=Clathrus columnatus TaxID=1419009 RepID=A0AAV5AQ13_9AGAM|nr:hypothetical protein Clacol_009251 [Clathrus columnatus]